MQDFNKRVEAGELDPNARPALEGSLFSPDDNLQLVTADVNVACELLLALSAIEEAVRLRALLLSSYSSYTATLGLCIEIPDSFARIGGVVRLISKGMKKAEAEAINLARETARAISEPALVNSLISSAMLLELSRSELGITEDAALWVSPIIISALERKKEKAEDEQTKPE